LADADDAENDVEDDSTVDAFDLEEFGFDNDSIELDMDDDSDAEEQAEETAASNQFDLDVDPVFIEILQKEVGSHLSEMAQFVSDSLGKNQPKINDNFVRVVHTLNGAASMASVDGITKMTTPLEKVSIMLMDRKQTLTADDLTHIEAVIKHANSQLNLLGTGTSSVDDSIGDYFVNRITELNTTAEESKDAEGLVVENNQLEEQFEAENIEETDEIELTEEEAAEEEVVEDAPEPFQKMAEVESTEATVAASELELDEELLEIFSEEASEIFDREKPLKFSIVLIICWQSWKINPTAHLLFKLCNVIYIP